MIVERKELCGRLKEEAETVVKSEEMQVKEKNTRKRMRKDLNGKG